MENTKVWDFIDVYSRKDALADGVQVLANPETTKEAGILYPVYLTQKVYNKYVKVPEGMECFQQEDARLRDIFTMLKYYIKRVECTDFLEFKVSVSMPDVGDWSKNEKMYGSRTQRLVTLHATIGAMDFDDPSPAFTIMIPDED